MIVIWNSLELFLFAQINLSFCQGYVLYFSSTDGQKIFAVHDVCQTLITWIKDK